MSEIRQRGLIIKAQSGFFTVEMSPRRHVEGPASSGGDARQGLIVCQLRGKLKRGRATGDIAAVGDRVRITVLTDGTGVIEEVEERERAIVRLDPRPQGEYRQILLANPDQAVFVFACAHPDPRLRMLDRYLVIAEKQKISAVIVANKIDLVADPEEIFGMYESIGYRVLYTSVKTGEGIEKLHRALTDKLSALAGPSGAGKSSLLNAIQPGLGLEVSGVSATMGKGTHTTVTRQLFPLEGGGYVADTPGWKSLALWDTQPEEIDAYFPELRELVADCQFSDCTHVHEPGCAVRAALDQGKIHPERYESYLRLRAGED